MKTLSFNGILLFVPLQLHKSMKSSVNSLEKSSTRELFFDFRYPIWILRRDKERQHRWAMLFYPIHICCDWFEFRVYQWWCVFVVCEKVPFNIVKIFDAAQWQTKTIIPNQLSHWSNPCMWRMTIEFVLKEIRSSEVRRWPHQYLLMDVLAIPIASNRLLARNSKTFRN